MTTICIGCLLPFVLESGEGIVERSESMPNAYCVRCFEDAEADDAVVYGDSGVA